MAQWIEVKARYEKTLENGTQKKVVEPYLVDALSCTEAEARVVEELSSFTSGDLSVTACNKTKYSDVFGLNETGDRFYKVKVNFITLDEKTAVEKKSASYVLVRAIDFHNALANFMDGMGTMADFEIEQICETKIVDVYTYRASINKVKVKVTTGNDD